MVRSNLKRAVAIGLGTLAVPVGIAVAGAAPASAGPELCATGPCGCVSACVEAPGWELVRQRSRWRGHGHGHGHDD